MPRLVYAVCRAQASSAGHGLTSCGTRSHISVVRCRFHTPAAQPYGNILTARRHVHEQPFQDLPEDLSQGEAYAMARDALLQLNIMHRRGIEPDALMYTSLIATMGRAGLEWQAYKLFSRMIEQNIQPLPETYVALRDATSKQRAALREQIQTKIEEAVNVFPEELADTERKRQREEDRRCIAKFNEYMRGVLPAATSASSPVAPDLKTSGVTPSTSADGTKTSTGAPLTSSGALPSDAAVSTMHIRSPRDAWGAAQMAQEQRRDTQSIAHGEAAVDLRTALQKLDDEELRIYLAAQRQLRHGAKDELIDRVLQKVSAVAILAMLDRRAHYFRSVEQILAADLRQLNMAGPMNAPPETKAAETPHPATGADRTLTKGELDAVSPDVLYAPWGILRKPARRQREPPAPRNAARLERVRLSEVELGLVQRKAEHNDLDELPESLLRRYAYQFQLRWRRKDGATSLLRAVQWHVTTYFNAALQPTGEGHAINGAPPTPAIRLQKEEEGMRQTLENFETFRVIAQRTNNLQVVDSKEINRHLQHVWQDTVRRERKAEHALRRERHVMEAAGLAASAKSFTPPAAEDVREMQVLGVAATAGEAATEESQRQLPDVGSTSLTTTAEKNTTEDEEKSTNASDEDVVSELPPWALFEEEDEFNLSSGRFGDPTVGRFQELSDSKVRVLPSRAAQAKWSVDRQLLPASLKDIVQEAELERQHRDEAIEKEYERRLQYTKYRKWDHLIAKSQAKQAARRAKEAEEGVPQPLPPKRRLSQLLRRGHDRQRVSMEMQTKYNRKL